MPKYVEDVCQLQNLIKVSFPKTKLGRDIFLKSLLKIFRARKKQGYFRMRI